MMILGKHLERRTFLRGVGTAVALPMLDAMVPAFARAASTKAPCRMGFVYVPNGIIMDQWTPKVEADIGPLPADLPRVSAPLAAFREDLMMLGGLTCNGGRELGMVLATTAAPAPPTSRRPIPRRPRAGTSTPESPSIRSRHSISAARPSLHRSNSAARTVFRAETAITDIAAPIATAFRGGPHRRLILPKCGPAQFSNDSSAIPMTSRWMPCIAHASKSIRPAFWT